MKFFVKRNDKQSLKILTFAMGIVILFGLNSCGGGGGGSGSSDSSSSPSSPNTPSSPSSPNTPSSPDVADSPNSPDSPGVADSPNSPDVADSPNSSVVWDPLFGIWESGCVQWDQIPNLYAQVSLKIVKGRFTKTITLSQKSPNQVAQKDFDCRPVQETIVTKSQISRKGNGQFDSTTIVQSDIWPDIDDPIYSKGLYEITKEGKKLCVAENGSTKGYPSMENSESLLCYKKMSKRLF